MLLSPIILAVLVVVFGLFPGLLTQSIVEPATTAISGMSNVNAEFHLFHGITPAFISTLIIWILGILLLLTFSYWIRLLHAQPTRLTLNHWYDSTGKYLPNYSANMTNSYVNGYVRDSLVIIFGMLIVVTIVTLLSVPFDFNFKDINNIHIYEIAILILLIIAKIYGCYC